VSKSTKVVLSGRWRNLHGSEARLRRGEPEPPAPEVTFFLDPCLYEFGGSRTVRWAVLGTGRIAAGPGDSLLHADMMLGTSHLNEGSPLAIGWVLLHRRSWVMALCQPFVPGLPQGGARVLLDRLSTWTEFLSGERLHWPEPGEYGQELLDRLDNENPQGSR
jgi:hypothetical protein